eukprot:tig00000823_g4537.t1
MARTRESDVLYNNGDLDGEIRQRNVDLEDANAVLEGRRTSSGAARRRRTSWSACSTLDLNGDWADLQALWTAFANRKSQILALPAQVQQRIIDFVAPWRDESLQQPFMQPRFLSGLRSAFFHLAVSSDRYFTPQRIVHGEFGIPPSG